MRFFVLLICIVCLPSNAAQEKVVGSVRDVEMNLSVYLPGVLEDELSSWDSGMKSHYVFRARPDSLGSCLYVHCKPDDDKGNGCLIRIEDGKKTLVNSELPARYVWWNNTGEIVAYSKTTPFFRAAIGFNDLSKRPHIIQTKDAEFSFGTAEQVTLFDVSEDGRFFYVFRRLHGKSVDLLISNIKRPYSVLLEKKYPTLPYVFVRGDSLHIFSHTKKGYGCRTFLHEKMQISEDELILRSSFTIKAKKTLFSSFYSVETLDPEAKYLFIACVVDNPFGCRSHFQRISLDGMHSIDRLRSIPLSAKIHALAVVPTGK